MPNILDSLLDRIGDAALRDALGAEVRRLREGTDFGLVFERHLPETVRLLDHPIRRGITVQDRSDIDSPRCLVRRVKGDVATLVTPDGEELERPVDDLVVVRNFGDPIYPGLRRLGQINRGGDKPCHSVIKGENFHALEMLLYAYEGRVDCAYLDPPFNTGSKDWKYNNRYVDDDDLYRHSKWLAFMERRLRLVKRLLNPEESVLIVAIDENEVHRLALLLEDIFRGCKMQMVTALINPAGATIIDQFHRVDEHLLFVHIGSARPIRTTVETTPLGKAVKGNGEENAEENGDAPTPKPKKFQWESLQRSGGNSRRQDTKAKFFPIYVDPEGPRIVGCGDHLPAGVDRGDAPAPPDGVVQQWPIKEDGSEACWQVSAPTFRKYLAAGRIRIGRKKNAEAWGMAFLTKGHMKAIEDGELVVTGSDRNGALVVENAPDRARTRPGKTMWTAGRYSATEHGSTLLRSFIPKRKFPYPKSLYAVEDALRFYVGNKPDAVILDIFAGSGTTMHAVARLNHQDGGRRVSISVTNNEVSPTEAEALEKEGLRPGDPDWEALGIFEYITRPRIEAAMTGRTADGQTIEGDYRFIDEFPYAEGFAENVEFLELLYLDRNDVERGKLFESLAPLLWMRAGARGSVVEQSGASYALPEDASYGVLFAVEDWRAFVDAVDARPDITHVYVLADSVAQFQQIAAALSPTVRASILYDDYLRSFELNTADDE
jgi:adenine-specific DNA-methyltransferase